MKKYQTEEERKQARKEYLKQWREKNAERLTEYHKKWYEVSKEKIAEYYKQYRKDNAEKLAEKQRQYRKQYDKTPMGRASLLVNNHNQKDKQMGRGECSLTALWIHNYIFPFKCIYCGESDWKKLGCDRKDNSLPHTPSNVVPCCGECNKKRGTKPFEEFLAECNAEGRLKEWETFLAECEAKSLENVCLTK